MKVSCVTTIGHHTHVRKFPVIILLLKGFVATGQGSIFMDFVLPSQDSFQRVSFDKDRHTLEKSDNVIL